MVKRTVGLVLMTILMAFPLISIASSFDVSHATAYMLSYFTCGCSIEGTGAMTGRYGLITAAHNLYCQNHGKPLKGCLFYFGARKTENCFYEYSGGFSYTVYDTFQNGYSSKNDIGYIVFDTPVGDITGWFGVMYGYRPDSDDLELKNYSQGGFLQSLRTYFDFEIEYVDGKQIRWPCVFYRWTTGGPIYSWPKGQDFPRIMAVYTATDNSDYSYGRLITEDIFFDMKADGALE